MVELKSKDSISTLTDVDLTGLLDGYEIYYDAATAKWKVRAHSTAHINRLKGIIGTFSGFDTNPSSPENMTDENYTTETGEGVKSLAGVNGAIGYISFDMGAAYPVTILPRVNFHRASGDGTIYMYVTGSTDGVSYYDRSTFDAAGTTPDVYRPCDVVTYYGRYIRLVFTTGDVTVNPSVFHVKVAEVMALQLK